MINGKVWYVPNDEFTHFNVAEHPIAILSNYVRGSRGPFIKVNSEPDMTGEVRYVNANHIIDVGITYEPQPEPEPKP